MGRTDSGNGRWTCRVSPTWTNTLFTVPERSAFITFCIFMASSTPIGSPSTTSDPSSTASETSEPGIGDMTYCAVHTPPEAVSRQAQSSASWWPSLVLLPRTHTPHGQR